MYSSFRYAEVSAGKEVGKNPVAASAAAEVTAGAWLVQPAPADAKRKRNGDSVVWLKKRTQRLAGVEKLACGPRGYEQKELEIERHK